MEPSSQLPTPYALALRLRDVGADDALIADCLEVEPAAVPSLLTLAVAKLDAAREDQSSRAGDHTATAETC